MTKDAEVMSWEKMKVQMSPGHHKLAICNYTKLEEHLGCERWLIWGEFNCPAKNYF